MGEYRTIKELVIDACIAEGTFPSYDKLTSLVLRHFPTSKWQKSHYAWYKSKIKTGDIVVPGFLSPKAPRAMRWQRRSRHRSKSAFLWKEIFIRTLPAGSARSRMVLALSTAELSTRLMRAELT